MHVVQSSSASLATSSARGTPHLDADAHVRARRMRVVRDDDDGTDGEARRRRSTRARDGSRLDSRARRAERRR
jgi:hypothetical protein